MFVSNLNVFNNQKRKNIYDFVTIMTAAGAKPEKRQIYVKLNNQMLRILGLVVKIVKFLLKMFS